MCRPSSILSSEHTHPVFIPRLIWAKLKLVFTLSHPMHIHKVASSSRALALAPTSDNPNLVTNLVTTIRDYKSKVETMNIMTAELVVALLSPKHNMREAVNIQTLHTHIITTSILLRLDKALMSVQQ